MSSQFSHLLCPEMELTWGFCTHLQQALNIQTMEYYSAIKKNEIMPLTATWMDLELVVWSEVSWLVGRPSSVGRPGAQGLGSGL